MALQIKVGVATLVMLWIAVCSGLYAGAAVGFTVEDRANATISFNADTGDLRVGSNTSNLYESPSDEDLEKRDADKPDWQQDTEENLQSALPELNEPPKLLPDRVTDPAGQAREEMVNETAAQMTLVVTWIGDPTAEWVFDNRDWLHEETVYGLVALISISPFVTVGYALFKRFKRFRR